MSILLSIPANAGDRIVIRDLNHNQITDGDFQNYQDSENGAIYTLEGKGVFVIDKTHLVTINEGNTFKVSRNYIWDKI